MTLTVVSSVMARMRLPVWGASDAEVVHSAGAADADVVVYVDAVLAEPVSVGEASLGGESFRGRGVCL